MPESQEIRVLVAPIPGSAVIVPGSVVAEVIDFEDPKPFRDAPDWLPGELAWNGWKIPVINLAILAGTHPDTLVHARSRILVVKTLTEAASVLHLGIIISGLPRLQTVTRSNFEETGKSDVEGVFSQVKLEGQPGLLPDFDALAVAVERAVYRNS